MEKPYVKSPLLSNDLEPLKQGVGFKLASAYRAHRTAHGVRHSVRLAAYDLGISFGQAARELGFNYLLQSDPVSGDTTLLPKVGSKEQTK